MFIRNLMTGDFGFMPLREGEGGGGGGAGEGDGANKGGDGGGEGDGANKGGSQPAFSTMPEGPVRDLMATKAYDSYDKVADAYYNLTRLHRGSADIIERPQADATPEQMTEFYNKVNGVPESVEGYKLEFDKDAQVDEEFVGAAKGWFHEVGLRPDQAQAIAVKYNEFAGKMTAKMAEGNKAANDTAVAQLKQKYEGQGKGAWDQVVANGQKAVQALGLTGEHLERFDAANSVAANIELLAIIGEKLGEARNIDGAAAGGNFTPETAEQARVEIARLQNDKPFQDSLLDPNNAMHPVNLRKWQSLQKVAFAKGS